MVRSRIRRFAANHRSLIAWTAVFLWLTLIFIYSGTPAQNFPTSFSFWNYIVHIVEFTVLAFLLTYAFDKPWRHGWQIACLALITTSMLGLGDEFHQYFIPGRMPQVADWVIDSAGGILGTLFGTWSTSASWTFSMSRQRWKKQVQHAQETGETMEQFNHHRY